MIDSKDTTPNWLTCPSLIAGKVVPSINPAAWPAAQKQQLWRGIQRSNPNLAAMLRTDTNIVRLKSVFCAVVVFTQEEVDSYIEAGRLDGSTF